MSQRDEKYMSLAIRLARRGLGRTSPNPLVGCVIVKKGKILATGFHKKAGLDHAEIKALNKIVGVQRAAAPLRGAILYVNLEPCCHHGRTPPCAEAIIQSGIREVIVGMKDPDLQVSGKGIQILKKAGLRVRVGILQRECEKLNEAYLIHRTKRRPFVILKMALTLDGKVGIRGSRVRITGDEALRFGHRLRNQVDAILVGRGTVLTDNPRLTTRLKKRGIKNPTRIVLDSKLRLPPATRVFHQPGETIVVTTSPAPLFKKEGLGEILICKKDKEGRIDLKDLLKQLGRRGIVSLLVEGGAEVWESFLRGGFVDEIVLLLSPRILGKGVSAPLDPLLSPLYHFKGVMIGEDILIHMNPQSGV